MPVRRCPFPDCDFVTDDVSDALAVEYFAIHRPLHVAPAVAVAAAHTKQKAPKIDRPKIATGSSEEVWSAFTTRWAMFKRGTELTEAETVQQLFQCCSDALGDSIIKGYPSAARGTEQNLLDVIKKLAARPRYFPAS